jgi:nucleoside 2-deoxyribosyltransferase
MILYLAARYSRKDEIREYAKRFENAGHQVSATWFDEPHDGQVTMAEVCVNLLQTYAQRDFDEIKQANAIVFYSETDQTMNKRGGRHVEFGYALGLGKRIIVVGPKENIFHYLPVVEHFSDMDDVVMFI